MGARRSATRFYTLSFGVWCAMVVILVVVPDWLHHYVALELARGIGWAIACGVWVVAVEAEWKARFGPFARFFLQLTIWVAAALLAIWISEQANLRTGI